MYNLWKSDKESETLKNNYKKFSKKLDKEIKLAKDNYEIKLAQMSCNEPKNLWKYIDNKLGRKKKTCTIDKIKIGDSFTTELPEITNTFNVFFAKVGLNLAKLIHTSNSSTDQLNTSDKIINPNSIFLYPTSTTEVSNIIQGLKNRKGGIDSIHSKVLKSLSPFISPAISYIFNKCISKGIWPKALKKAEIVPVYKSGDKLDVNNYRPISIISNIAKILERIVYNRLYNFFHKFKIINKKQYSYQKNKNATYALVDVLNTIYSSIENDDAVIGTFIDLKKAFDTVSHKILFKKLYNVGIRGVALNLIISYLSDRTQKVRIGDVTSYEENISLGVPQGTVLGPMLFLIYINDIFERCPNIFAFADDTLVLSVEKTWLMAENRMNEYLNNLNEWFKVNKLTLNKEKTEYLTFGCYVDSVPQSLKIHIENCLIKRKDNIKYLGLIVDFNLKWDLHIKHITGRCRYFLYIVNKLKHLPYKVLFTIYYAYVYSILNYALVIWGGAYATELFPIDKLQKKFIKILKAKNIPELECLYKTSCIIHFYENLKNQFGNSNSITRHKQLSLPYYKKTIARKNPIYTATKYFNGLPNELKSLNIINKKKIVEKIYEYYKSINIFQTT